MISALVITDPETGATSDMAEVTTKLECSWTLDGVSQIQFDVEDSSLALLLGNNFELRRNITHAGTLFEISSHNVKQGSTASASHTVEARTKAVQLMKRDKNPQSYGGVSATDFVRIVAEKFGLRVVAEASAIKNAIIQSQTTSEKESVWDVIQRLASDCQFVAFESDGTLFFCSQRWLLGKWANLPLVYPSHDSDQLVFVELPDCRVSDDDPNGKEFRAVLLRNNATNLRAGMTVGLAGMGTFDGAYIITEVAYEEGSNDPVGIGARTPEKTKPT